MKTNASLRTFKLATLAIVIALGLSIGPAQAVPYVVTLQQVGSNIVATGNGAIDLTGLSFAVDGAGGSVMFPSAASILTGSPEPDTLYRGLISGPTSFGTGLFDFGTGTGDLAGIAANPVGVLPTIYVPQGYVSTSLLSDSATYNNATFSSLGVTPGTYLWTWGTGPDQNFTLQIGPVAGVPEQGSTLGLLFLALIALLGANRLRSMRLA
jgi:hypothetical protein